MKRAVFVLVLLTLVPGFAADAGPVELRVRVVADVANIRGGADLNAPVVMTAKAGEVFSVIERSGDWYAISLPSGGRAYVHRSVVEEVSDQAAQAAPPAAPQRKPASPPAPSASSGSQSRPPAASTAAGPKLYVRAGYDMGFSEQTQSLGFSRTVYYESATYRLEYGLKKGGSIDAAVGYMFGPSLGVEFGGSHTTRDLTETTSVSVPHPLWMGTPRAKDIAGSGLKLSEIDLYLNLVYDLRFSKFGLSLTGGPCFMMATATIVSDIVATETGYPYMDVDISLPSSGIKKNVFGFNGGAALSVNLGRSLAVGIDARYVAGSGSFKPEGDIPELKLTLGGFRIGAGLKLRF